MTRALLVTDDDMVWTLEGNSVDGHGRVSEVRGPWERTQGVIQAGGRECLSEAPEPVKIPRLCGKAVQSFAYSDDKIVLALTGNGAVYAWGTHSLETPGISYFHLKVATPELIYDTEDPAVEIACGSHHATWRTKSGAVYDFTFIDHRTPNRVEGSIKDLKCIQISCSSSTTVAAFENDELYTWNYARSTAIPIVAPNGLRLGGRCSSPPRKIEHPKNVIFRKIACTSSYVFALGDGGSLHMWRAFSPERDQMNNTEYSRRAPQRPFDSSLIMAALLTKCGHIREIAASNYSDTLAAMTETGKVLMWGKLRGSFTPLPIETPFESVQDAFASWSPVEVTPAPIVVTGRLQITKAPSWERTLLDTLAEQFDNPSVSDLKFVVDGKVIHVHKMVLKLQSEYFRTMFQGAWMENESNTVNVTEYSYPVYKAFLRYFYTGEVDVPVDEILDLIDLANSCFEDVLKVKCREIIEKGISIENCAGLYKAAIRYNDKNLEEFCLRFAADRFSAITETDAFETLTDDILRKFISGVKRYGAFKT